MCRVIFTTPRKRRVEARRAHLLTRAHGGRVPGRHRLTKRPRPCRRWCVSSPARARPPPLRPSREQQSMSRGSGRFASRANEARRALPSRIHRRLTHRASPLTFRRFKRTGEDHAEAAGRHGGGLRRAGPSPAFRAIRSIPTGLGNAEPRPSRSSLTRHPHPQWDGGKGSHHPNYDPHANGDDVVKASRETEELLNAIVKVRDATGHARRGRSRRLEAEPPPNRRRPFFLSFPNPLFATRSADAALASVGHPRTTSV